MTENKKPKDQISDYCLMDREIGNRLSSFERLTLIGGQELEKAVSWFSKQLTRFTYLEQFGQFDVSALKEAVKLFSTETLLSNPSSYFVAPKIAPLVELTEIHGLPDGSIFDLTFLSSYQVQNQELTNRYAGYLENRTLHARWWKHTDRQKRPVIVAVHGWTMGDQRVNSLAFQPGYFYRIGFDVVLVELPFHGRRAPSGQQAQTTVFPSTDFVLTNEAIAQAISDLRELKLFLNTQDPQAIGVMGMSLGAYVSALWASLDALDFCIPIVPLVSMADLAWKIVENSPQVTLYQNQGLTRKDFDLIYRVHCPLTYSVISDKERLLIVAGVGDKVVPPEQPKMLWQHWNNPNIFWFDGGHVAEAGKSRVFPEITKFFRGLKLVSTALK